MALHRQVVWEVSACDVLVPHQLPVSAADLAVTRLRNVSADASLRIPSRVEMVAEHVR